jgi:hypothetical protein
MKEKTSSLTDEDRSMEDMIIYQLTRWDKARTETSTWLTTTGKGGWPTAVAPSGGQWRAWTAPSPPSSAASGLSSTGGRRGVRYLYLLRQMVILTLQSSCTTVRKHRTWQRKRQSICSGFAGRCLCWKPSKVHRSYGLVLPHFTRRPPVFWEPIYLAQDSLRGVWLWVAGRGVGNKIVRSNGKMLLVWTSYSIPLLSSGAVCSGD